MCNNSKKTTNKLNTLLEPDQVVYSPMSICSQCVYSYSYSHLVVTKYSASEQRNFEHELFSQYNPSWYSYFYKLCKIFGIWLTFLNPKMFP